MPRVKRSRVIFPSALFLQYIASLNPAAANSFPSPTHNLGMHNSGVSHFALATTHGATHNFATNAQQNHALPSFDHFGLSLTSLPLNIHNAHANASFYSTHREMSTFATINTTHNRSLETVELDLTSAATSIVLTPGIITHGSSATINIGGTMSTFATGAHVTAAELVAIEQVQASGGQTIKLDSQGHAVGGSFSLNSVAAAGGSIYVSGIVVPKNVTATDLISSKSNVSLKGDLINFGTISEISNNRNATAILSAADIINEAGALISTSGRGAATGKADLTLTATKNLTNLGTIESSGALNITTGGSLSNTGALSSLTAVQDVTINSRSTANSGTISSGSGNINLNSSHGALNFANSGGVVSAPSGNINVNYSGEGSANISGGNLLSQQLNLNAGAGTVNVNAQTITGIVNSTGNAVHVNASTDLLKLGTQTLSGDPTFYNDKGGIQIAGNISANEDLTIIANGDITVAPTLTSLTISTTDSSGTGHDINIIAGANVTSFGIASPTLPGGTSSAASFSGASATGGSVNLSGANLTNLTITSQSTTAGSAGGNVTLAAYSGSVAGSGAINLQTSSAPANINAAGSAASSGNVTLIGPGGVTIGSILNGGSQGAQNVQIVTSQPAVSNGGTISFAPDGSISSGNQVVANLANIKSGAVKVIGAINAAGSVAINSGLTTTLSGPITGSSSTSALSVTSPGDITFGGTLAMPGGITLVSGANIASSNAGVGINSSSTGNGGNVTVIAGAAFNASTAGAVTISGTSSTGGVIDFDTHAIGVLNSTGAINGGNVTLIAFANAGGINGTIDIPTAVTTTTSGNTGINGNVEMIAGNNSAGSAIGLGANTININTAGGTGAGSIYLAAATPNTTAPVTVNLASGAVTAGDFTGGAVNNAVVNFGNLAVSGAAVTLLQNGNSNYTFSGTFGASSLNVQTGGSVSFANPVTLSNSLFVNAGGTTSFNGAVNVNTLSVASSGSISFNNAIAAPGGLTMVSGQAITGTGSNSSLSTSSAANSGNITLISGVNITSATGGAITINDISSATSFNGEIDLTASTQATVINTSSTSGSGGQVTLVSLSGIAGGASVGKILLPTGPQSIVSSGNGGNGGAVLALAGNPNNQTTIQVGGVLTGASAQGGSVGLFTQAPQAGKVIINQTGVTIGTITNSGTAVAGASITTGSIVTAGGGGGQGYLFSPQNGGSGGNAGAITLAAGNSNAGATIKVNGDLIAYGGGGGGGTGGRLTSRAGNGGGGGAGANVAITAGTQVTVTGTINVSGGGGGGGGGAGQGGIRGNGGSGGAAGNVLVSAPTSGIAGNVLALNGGNGGAGGTFFPGGGGGGAGGGSYGGAGAGGGGGTYAAGSGTGGGGGAGYFVSTALPYLSASGGGGAGGNTAGATNNGGGGGGYLGPGTGGLSNIVGANGAVGGNGIGGAGGSYSGSPTPGAGGTSSGLAGTGGGGGSGGGGGGNATSAAGGVVALDVNIFSINTTASTQTLTGLFSVNTNGAFSTGSLATVNANALSITAASNITIASNLNYVNGITLVSGGNVTTSANGLSISTTTAGNSGNITIVAGATFSATNSTVTISGASATGGNIDFATNQISTLSTATTAASASAGNITLAAFAAGNGTLGTVNVGKATVNTNGAGTGNNGSILVVAGNSSATDAINTSAQPFTATASGGLASSGNVTLAAGTPNTATPVQINASNAAIVSGNFFPTNPTASVVHFGTITTSATLTIAQGGDVSLGTTVLPNFFTLQAGHNINITGNVTGLSISLLAGNDINLGGSITGGSGITLIAGENVNTSNSSVSLDTSSGSGSGSSITIIAGAAFTNQGDTVSITGASSTGGKIDFATNPILAIKASGTVNGGSINMAAFSGSNQTGSVAISASTAIMAGGGAKATNGNVVIVAGQKALGLTTNGINLNTSIDLTGTGGTGGSIQLATSSPNATVLSPIIAGLGTAAGTIASGSILNGQVQTAGIIAGDLKAPAGSITVTSGQNVQLGNVDVHITGSGTSGSISVSSTGTSTLNIGTTGPNSILSLNANGAAGSVAAGSITVADTGNNGITINAPTDIGIGTSFGAGGSLTLNAGTGMLTFPSSLPANTLSINGITSGGMLTIIAGDIAPFVGTALTFDTSSVGGTAGTINIALSGNLVFNIGNAPIDFAFKNLGGGGSITVSTPNAQMNVDGSAFNIAATNNQTGTSLTLNALRITDALPGGPILLNTSGSGTGAAGNITITTTQTDLLKIGTVADSLSLIAQGGTASTSGGIITVSTGGNLTADPAALLFNSQGPDANGGSVTLKAGQNGPGTLIVSNILSALGTGTGSGGSIDLESNSSTAFVIGSASAKNGTAVGLSVLGGVNSAPGSNGSITIVNKGGGVTQSVNLTAVGTVSYTAGGAGGGVTVSKLLGDANTSTVTLKTINAGAISDSQILMANTVIATSNSGAITLSKLNVGSVTAITAQVVGAAKGVVKLTSVRTTAFDIAQVQGASVTIAAPTEVDSSGLIKAVAGNVSIASTASIKSVAPVGSIQLNGDVNATGTITLTAPQNISETGGTISGTAGVKATSKNSVVSSTGDILAGAKGSITLSGVGVTESGDMSAGSSVTITSKGGLVSVNTIGAKASTANLAITSNAGISSSGNILVTAKATETNSGIANIIVGGNIDVSSPKGAVTLKTSGAGGNIVSTAEDISAGSAVTISSTAGDLTLGTIGASKGVTPLTVTLSALNNITAQADITAINSVKATTSGKTAGGAITIDGNITASGAKGAVALTAGSGGQITDSNAGTSIDAFTLALKGPMGVTMNGNATTGGSIALTAASNTGGFITINSSSTLTSKTSTVSLSATNAITQNGIINAVTGITLATTLKSTSAANFITIGGNLETSAGSISVVGAGSSVKTVVGSDITANSDLTKTKAKVLIEASNSTLGSSAAITIDSKVETTGVGGNTITIAIGTPPTTGKNPLTNLQIAGIAINNNGGLVFGGTTLSSIRGPLSGPNAQLNTIGQNIILNSPNTLNTISFTSNAYLMADPPVNTPSIAALAVSIGALSNTTTSSSNTALSGAAVSNSTAALSAMNQTLNAGNPLGNISVLNQYAPLALQLDSTSADPVISIKSTGASTSAPDDEAIVTQGRSQSSNLLSGWVNNDLEMYDAGLANNRSSDAHAAGWASETELRNGQIPAQVLMGLMSLTDTSESHSPEMSTLNRGSILLALTTDRLIKTPSGEVKIKAGSLVLVMSFSHGLAVYNLHDRCKDSVQVTTGNEKIVLSPGRCLMLLNSSKAFEQINPAQLVAYRCINERLTSNALRAVEAQFSLLTAINAIQPLGPLLASKDPSAVRLANQLLKTTSIMMQLQASGPAFRQVLRPQVTACAR
jgi:mucin-19